MINTNNVNDLVGSTVFGSDGEKIGTVGQIYLDAKDQSPAWATVKTGLFGTSESFVPLRSARYEEDELHLPFDKAFVKDAPRIEDDGELSDDEVGALYAYYSDSGSSSVGDSAETDVDDNSRSAADGTMTRSEERLDVGTERVEAGRARLRKHVVTEEQTVTVPVSHEEVTIEREPITDASGRDAASGTPLSAEEREVSLTEERVVVTKENVPVERVKLGTEKVTEERQVTEEVSHEEIEIEEPTTRDPDSRH